MATTHGAGKADMQQFTIQYFGTHDRLHYAESVDVGEMVEALDRARDTLKAHHPAPGSPHIDPQLVGYVILDQRGPGRARLHWQTALMIRDDEPVSASLRSHNTL
jgi:hypothetical protein